jgi:hypothetical protein
MTQVGFEPTIPVFKQVKTVHALDRTTTVIGNKRHWKRLNYNTDHIIHLSLTKNFMKYLINRFT